MHTGLTVTEDLARIRAVLDAAEFTEKGLVGVLGPVQLPARLGREAPYFLHLTRGERPLDTLIRLFVVCVPVEEAAARKAFAPVPIEEWERAGLVETDGGAVVGRVRLLPYRNLLLACDEWDRLGPGEKSEQVMAITASSVALSDFTIRRQSRATLDLGTGGGVQAFLAAQHSDRVLATDTAARAINFARFNAALNGGEGIEFALGGGFEPAAGRRFDLIVSNPPFAITPSRRYAYRDSGMELDGFVRGLVRQAPEYLNDGGYLQMCCDWVHLAGQDWQERLGGWFEGTGCDAWVLRTDTRGPADYAHVWSRDTEYGEAQATARLYDEWVAYYGRNGVEAISTGLIVLRRNPGAANWVRIEDAPGTISGPFGDWVLHGFVLRDYLENADLLMEKLRVSAAVRLDEVCEPVDGGWLPASARIRMTQGPQYATPIDLRLAALVARCDGRRTLYELLVEMAERLRADLEKITPNILGLTRQLIERGFLVPAGVEEPGAH